MLQEAAPPYADDTVADAWSACSIIQSPRGAPCSHCIVSPHDGSNEAQKGCAILNTGPPPVSQVNTGQSDLQFLQSASNEMVQLLRWPGRRIRHRRSHDADQLSLKLVHFAFWWPS
eukprot:2088096-Amphidinium_carterae.1